MPTTYRDKKLYWIWLYQLPKGGRGSFLAPTTSKTVAAEMLRRDLRLSRLPRGAKIWLSSEAQKQAKEGV